MEHTTVRKFVSPGSIKHEQKIQECLDIAKSEVYRRLKAAIEDRRPGITAKHLLQLDAGTLPMGVLGLVFTKSEIAAAAASGRAKIIKALAVLEGND